MTHTPSIDYGCTRYGARHVYQLVPLEEQPIEDEVKAMPHEIPSIDLRCSRCGTSQTYKVVPDSVSTPPLDRQQVASTTTQPGRDADA